MSLCQKCANANCNHAVEPGEVVVQCGAYKTPMTNADRIRTMSNEELANALYGMQKDLCRHIVTEIGYPGELDFADDAPDLLEWLQQPAEEDDRT